MKKIILSILFLFAFIPFSRATTIFPWESRIETCSSATDGTDKSLCLDSSSFVLSKCQTSGGTCNQVVNIGGTATNLSGTPALPNGTTATTQSIGDNSTKLATTAYVQSSSPVINVLNYGVKGDCSTDDTAAINSAIASGVTLANAMTVPTLTTRDFHLVYNGSSAFKVY